MTDLPKTNTLRIRSIDVLRAVTMVLMIWVNDFWTLIGVPEWLEHMPAAADAMGFSDTIFPAFMVIVGLSIPFALDKRIATDKPSSVVWHILIRSFALILMGLMHVNLENIYPDAMVIPKYCWQILLTISFFLLWNDYRATGWPVKRTRLLQGMGLLILTGLIIVYRGGDAEHVVGIRQYWWGILGLIGWGYLWAALFYWIFRGGLLAMIGGWIFFTLIHLSLFAGYLGFLEGIHFEDWMPDHGTYTVLAMGGIVASSFYKQLAERHYSRFIALLLLLSFVMVVYGWLTRPDFELSKIRATPAWIGYCTAITLTVYALIYYVVDVRKWDGWYRWIKPAGSSTLTTYLVPYIYYAVWSIWAIRLPEALRTGGVGLFKSFLFALLIVAITGMLNRWKIRLKI